MVRRGVAVVAGVILLILIVVGINGCLKSAKTSSLKSYNRNVGELVQQADSQVARPFFAELAGAKSKNPLDVEVQINQYRIVAENEAKQAKGFSVPGDMAGAQRALLMMLDLRSQALGKVADLVRTALGTSTTSDATNQIAGEMEVFLASDVLYSQRVAPLIQQALTSNGIQGETTAPSRFVPDLGWLDPNTLSGRLGGTGVGATANRGPAAPGVHGHAQGTVTVGATTLTAGSLTRVPGAANADFKVAVMNVGVNDETNVKVDVTVKAATGNPIAATKTIDRTKAGSTTTVDIPLTTAPPVGVPVTATVNIEPVPGEKTFVHNKKTYTIIFTS